MQLRYPPQAVARVNEFRDEFVGAPPVYTGLSRSSPDDPIPDECELIAQFSVADLEDAVKIISGEHNFTIKFKVYSQNTWKKYSEPSKRKQQFKHIVESSWIFENAGKYHNRLLALLRDWVISFEIWPLTRDGKYQGLEKGVDYAYKQYRPVGTILLTDKNELVVWLINASGKTRDQLPHGLETIKKICTVRVYRRVSELAGDDLRIGGRRYTVSMPPQPIEELPPSSDDETIFSQAEQFVMPIVPPVLEPLGSGAPPSSTVSSKKKKAQRAYGAQRGQGGVKREDLHYSPLSGATPYDPHGPTHAAQAVRTSRTHFDSAFPYPPQSPVKHEYHHPHVPQQTEAVPALAQTYYDPHFPTELPPLPPMTAEMFAAYSFPPLMEPMDMDGSFSRLPSYQAQIRAEDSFEMSRPIPSFNSFGQEDAPLFNALPPQESISRNPSFPQGWTTGMLDRARHASDAQQHWAQTE